MSVYHTLVKSLKKEAKSTYDMIIKILKTKSTSNMIRGLKDKYRTLYMSK